MKSLIWMLVGFGVGIIVGRSIGGNQHSAKTGASTSCPPQSRRPSGASKPETISPSPVLPPEPPVGKEWFRKQMQAYEDAMLAFFISKRCLDMNVSATKTMELYKLYGRVPLQPALTEYEAGFREQGLSVATLGKLGVEWLKEQGVVATAENWEDKATALLEERQSKNANKIINDFLNN